MTREEAKGFIQGKLDCMDRCDVSECKGTNECDSCNYCYSQGNFGEQKKAFEMAIEELGNDTNVSSKWIPCSEKLPDKAGFYVVTKRQRSGEIQVALGSYRPLFNEWSGNGNFKDVLAWLPLPEAYKGE